MEPTTTAAATEGATTFPPFDPSLFASQLIWFALTFIALYIIMSRVALPRVQNVIERREVTVKGDLEAAAINSSGAEAERVSAEEALAKARADARSTVEAMRAKVQAELGADQEKAEAKIAKKIGEAEAKIAATRQEGLTQVEAMASDLAKAIVAKLAPSASGGERKRA
ncbi:MAG: ATP F0F1 synthase subunit B [Pseudomonadota bacterium]